MFTVTHHHSSATLQPSPDCDQFHWWVLMSFDACRLIWLKSGVQQTLHYHIWDHFSIDLCNQYIHNIAYSNHFSVPSRICFSIHLQSSSHHLFEVFTLRSSMNHPISYLPRKQPVVCLFATAFRSRCCTGGEKLWSTATPWALMTGRVPSWLEWLPLNHPNSLRDRLWQFVS